WKQRLTA
ncbi:hypothetical protein M514_28686, partial [Trichuris suis]